MHIYIYGILYRWVYQIFPGPAAVPRSKTPSASSWPPSTSRPGGGLGTDRGVVGGGEVEHGDFPWKNPRKTLGKPWKNHRKMVV